MGKRRATPGTRQLNVEVDDPLITAWREYVRRRGESQRQAIERAMRRDMANPPDPQPDPPLPPVPPDPPKRRKPKEKP